MAAKKGRKTQKPVWERGYNGHVLWLGKIRLGKVTVHAGGKAAGKHTEQKYTWEAGGRAGASDQLDKARAAVEAAVLLADRQLDLFD